MPKYSITVTFKNASVFENSRSSNDRVFHNGNSLSRSKADRLLVPENKIDVRHVSNLIHVLMGERPTPSLRSSGAKKDPEIVKSAKNARYKLNRISSRETKFCRKAVGDSWQKTAYHYSLKDGIKQVKGGHLYASRLKRYIGSQLYEEFLKLSDSIAAKNSPKKHLTTRERIELLSQNGDSKKVNAFAIKCKQSGATSLHNLIMPKANYESIGLHQSKKDWSKNALLISGAPESVSRYNGVIYVPADDDNFINRLENGNGTATFLEGGFAYIDDVEPWSELLIADTDLVKPYELESLNVSN
jgi:hypothetical protein